MPPGTPAAVRSRGRRRPRPSTRSQLPPGHRRREAHPGCVVLRLLVTTLPRWQADPDAREPSPGEATRCAQPGLGMGGSAATNRSNAMAASAHACARHASWPAWRPGRPERAPLFESSFASASCSRRCSDNIRMRSRKSAFDCSRAAAFRRLGPGRSKRSARWTRSGAAILRPATALHREKTQIEHSPQPDVAEIQFHQLAPCRKVPEANRLIMTARRQGATIRRKRHGVDLTGMPLERCQEFSGGDVPQRHAPAITGHGQGLAVR